MGYYSQVSYAIEFPNEGHLKNFVATFRVIPELKEALDETRVTGRILFFDQDCVKWYEDFSQVRAHTRLINEANDMGYATCFLRIGEEQDGVEHESQDGEHEDYGNSQVCGYDLLSVRTAIVKGFHDDNPVTVDKLLGLTEGE